jgi:hypothetical protein
MNSFRATFWNGIASTSDGALPDYCRRAGLLLTKKEAVFKGMNPAGSQDR